MLRNSLEYRTDVQYMCSSYWLFCVLLCYCSCLRLSAAEFLHRPGLCICRWDVNELSSSLALQTRHFHFAITKHLVPSCSLFQLQMPEAQLSRVQTSLADRK